MSKESWEWTQIFLDPIFRNFNVIISLFNSIFLQYLSTLLKPAQAHKHFQFPATALYFCVLGMQQPPVKERFRERKVPDPVAWLYLSFNQVCKMAQESTIIMDNQLFY